MKGQFAWLLRTRIRLNYQLVGATDAQDIVLSLTGSKPLQKVARIVDPVIELAGVHHHVRKTLKKWVTMETGQHDWLSQKKVSHGLG